MIAQIKKFLNLRAPFLWSIIKRAQRIINIKIKMSALRGGPSVRVTVSPGIEFNAYKKAAPHIECFAKKDHETEIFQEMQAFLKLAGQKTCFLDKPWRPLNIFSCLCGKINLYWLNGLAKKAQF